MTRPAINGGAEFQEKSRISRALEKDRAANSQWPRGQRYGELPKHGDDLAFGPETVEAGVIWIIGRNHRYDWAVMKSSSRFYRPLIHLLVFGWIAWFSQTPAYSLSPAPIEDCRAYGPSEVRQVMPEIQHSFAAGETLQVCRVRPTGEASYHSASVINSEMTSAQERLCYYTSRRLFVSHDTPQEKRFTAEAPEGRGFLARAYTHALVTTGDACPKQYDDRYAIIDRLNVKDFLTIKRHFDSQVATKNQALNFWRSHTPPKPGLFGAYKSPDEYAPYIAVLNTIEATLEYSPPGISKLGPGHAVNHCRIIAEAAAYSAVMDFACDQPDFATAAISLFPRRQ